MATTRELIDALERNNALFNVAMQGTDAATGGMNPLVADALAAPAKTTVAPTADPNKVNVTLGGTLGGATVPVTPGAVTVNPVPVNAAPVAQTPVVDVPQQDSFYDMILRNDQFRLANKENFERREKANKARTAIAAVSDALASLGNLVGTTQGAPSQTQTYMTPFVTEQVEADRTRARALADRLAQNENSIRLTQAREDMTTDAYAKRMALQQALEDARTQRALAQIQGRSDLEDKKFGHETDKLAQKAGYTREQHDIDNAVKLAIAEGRNATSIKTTGMRVDQADRVLDAKKNGEIGAGSGGVGGYSTQTDIEYDDMGRKVKETKTRTGTNGQTTTTTTERASGGKKPNPMGSAPAQEGKKKKKKNPMN